MVMETVAIFNRLRYSLITIVIWCLVDPRISMLRLILNIYVPFNITSYAILLELIAKETNMVADELIMSLENTHIYLNQIEGIEEQLARISIHDLPTLTISESKSIFTLEYDDIKIENYKSQNNIKFPLSN